MRNSRLWLAIMAGLMAISCASVGIYQHWSAVYDKTQRGVVKVEDDYSVGSGIIISEEGEILTNEHVVTDATEVKVIFFNDDKFTCDADVVNTSAEFDIALLKLRDCPYTLTVLPTNTKDRPTVGDGVMAIGHPFNFDKSATVGIISCPYLKVQGQWYIQHDAAINPGSSGGPLLNLQGEVIGINAAGMPQGDGVAFAVPIGHALKLVDIWRN